MEWIRTLLSLEPHLPALTVHLRTRKEMSDVPAHWELMPDIVRMRDEIQAAVPHTERTLIIGNGDVSSLADAAAKVRESGCDGAMIGRGIFGTPWFFEKRAHEWKPAERLTIMVEHAKLFEKTFRNIKNFAVMRKHFKAYVSGWDGAKELRAKLMEAEDAKAVAKIVKVYLVARDN